MSLPIPARDPRIMTGYQQMPQRPAEARAGYGMAAAGQGIRQIGEDVQDWQQQRDKQQAAQVKHELEVNKANANLENMIQRRVLARQIHDAKQKWAQKEYELDQTREARAQTTADQKTTEHEQAVDLHKNTMDFREKLRQEMKEAKEEGGRVTRTEAQTLADLYKVSGTKIADQIIDNWFPRIRSTSGDRGREDKRRIATNQIKFLESELLTILDEIEQVSGMQYTISRIIQDPYSLQREIMELPAESEQRRHLMTLEKEARKKVNEIGKAKAIAGVTGGHKPPVENPDANYDEDVAALMREIEATKARLDEKAKTLEE